MATVFWGDGSGADIATLTAFFALAGVPTDPNAVSCVITDPNGTAITHTFGGASPSDITKVMTGEYQLQVPCAIAGLWGYVWIGTGTASDIQAGTWTAQPVGRAAYYTSAEELQERLGLSGSSYTQTQLMAVQAATSWVNGHCGRHFNQVTETRTFMPRDVYELVIDDIVSVTSFTLDYNGAGVYDTSWVQDVNYQLVRGMDEFNMLASGEPRPYTRARVTNVAGAGNWFPFIYPFSRLDRVKITGAWGWPAVPAAVRNASLQLAVEMYKLKDAPFGVAGSIDLGAIRIVGANPMIGLLLEPYRSSKRRVGV